VSTPPVHTLHLVEFLALGGIERLLEQFARHTPPERARLHFFSYETGEVTGIGRELQELGVPLYTYQKRGGYDPAVVAKLIRIVQDHDIQVVHTHDFGPMEYALPLKLRFPRLRLVHTHHTLPHFVSNLRYKLFFQLASHFYHRIACVSESLQDEIREACPFATKRMVVVHNGIQLDRFERACPDEALAKSGRLRLVNIGRIAPQKNLPYLVSTCAQLKAAGIPFELHHAGTGSPEQEAELRELIASLGLRDSVQLHGFQRDVRPILAKADIFAFSSNWEGHPVAVLEAMASGKACVLSDIPAHRQFGTGAARFFSLEEKTSLFRLLAELHRNPAEIGRMAAASRQEAERNFGLDRTIGRYCELYA
jgi:glycosyltransferase involved in cell wall biosynthesis